MSNRTSMESKPDLFKCGETLIFRSQCLIEPVWNQNSPVFTFRPTFCRSSQCLIEPVWNQNYALSDSLFLNGEPWSQCLIEPVWNQNKSHLDGLRMAFLRVSMSNRTSMESKLIRGYSPAFPASMSQCLIEPVWNQNYR